MTKASDGEKPRDGGTRGAGDLEIFLVAVPGLEAQLAAEAKACGFAGARVSEGGVTFKGCWTDVWRANLVLRGPSRILARFTAFRAFHLAQLDKRARRVAWGEVLRADVPVRVEASCVKSKIYHSGAAAQRIARAITEELGAPITDGAAIVVKARIADDLVTLAVDTSGEALHKRGHKEAVAKAPMRETMAALLLYACGYDGRESVLDPMCGSGTFPIEAAEIAAGLLPGRSRAFAFEQLATFDAAAFQRLRAAEAARAARTPPPDVRFHGSDRDAGAITMSRANAARAGVSELTHFEQLTVSEIVRPEGLPGLVIVNPPYGERIGDRTALQALHRALGETLRQRFSGWRVGLVTSDEQLARATRLPWQPPSAPILHGGVRVRLYQTAALP